jgi:hypothetical protein
VRWLTLAAAAAHAPAAGKFAAADMYAWATLAVLVAVGLLFATANAFRRPTVTGDRPTPAAGKAFRSVDVVQAARDPVRLVQALGLALKNAPVEAAVKDWPWDASLDAVEWAWAVHRSANDGGTAVPPRPAILAGYH